jgi:pyruvate/2-oxoacid:ferredoxin oxidoreductase beta subunit
VIANDITLRRGGEAGMGLESSGATFVGRSYPGEIKHLIWLIGEAVEPPGYALVDRLDDEPDYDPGNRTAA